MSTTIDLAPLRFLVVEDQGFQRWALGNLLERLGARYVFCAADGRAALDLFAELDNKVDIVVTDLDMPGMDGMEFIRHLGTSARRPALILASALDRSLVSSVASMAQAYHLPLLGSLDKPVTERKLRELIERYEPEARPPVPARETYSHDEVRTALQRGQIEAFLQPKIHMQTGEVVGAEALARWRHPERGLVGAGAFVPVLEAAGDLDALNTAVVESALQACRHWTRAGHALTVAINVSQRSFGDPLLLDQMLRAVEAHGLDPRHVVIEVTESAMAVDVGRSLENLARLRMHHFGLSIDDYGTGYSSMQQLARIPFTEIKIDQSFVRNALSHRSSLAILETSLAMAAKLGITAVAEGVESRAEWDLLARLGCDVAQGYHVGKPMAQEDFHDWLRLRRIPTC